MNPEIYGENIVLKPALLPQNVVLDIYCNSFIKAFGEKPRTTDRKKTLAYCEEILEGYRKGELKSCLTAPLPLWLEPEVVEKCRKRKRTCP